MKTYRDWCRLTAEHILNLIKDEDTLETGVVKSMIKQSLTNLTDNVNFLECNSKLKTVIKRDGSLFWTKGGLWLREQYNGDVRLDKSRKGKNKLKHSTHSFRVEHPVPKEVAIRYIFENKNDRDLEHFTEISI